MKTMLCATCGREINGETGWTRHPDNTRTCSDERCWPRMPAEVMALYLREAVALAGGREAA